MVERVDHGMKVVRQNHPGDQIEWYRLLLLSDGLMKQIDMLDQDAHSVERDVCYEVGIAFGEVSAELRHERFSMSRPQGF